MFLQDFYEESDRTTRHRRGIYGLVFLAVFAYLTFVIVTCNSNRKTQEQIEQIISKSPKLSELDRFCRDIQKPNDFNLKYKQLGGNSLRSSISYGYKSDLRFPEVRDFYISYFEKEGWTRESLWDEAHSALPRLLEYRKGKHKVSLELGNFSDANYSFSCGRDL
jgi:hypothetical protein